MSADAKWNQFRSHSLVATSMSLAGTNINKFSIPLMLSFAAVIMFVTSATSFAAEGVDKNAPLEHQAEIKLAKADVPSADGKTLYEANCAACHQADGKGLPGAFPPLAKSDFIAGDKSKLMEVTVKGLSGPVTVNGVEYNNVMPAMNFLTDEELALVLNYVVNSWGNPGGKFKASVIAQYRAETGLEARQGGGERHPGTP
jgi:mono/diheme cytochrome c family protein